MTIQTRCPTCQTAFQVPEIQANKWVRCANCQDTFQARPDTTPPPTHEPEPVAPSGPVAPTEPSAPSPQGAIEGSGKAAGALGVIILMVLFGVIRSVINSGSSGRSPSSEAAAVRQALDSMPQNNDVDLAELLLKAQAEADRKNGQAIRSRAVRHAEFLAGQLEDEERGEDAAKELSETATVETIPVLIQALQCRKVRARQRCLDALERLAAPESAAGVARFLATPDGESAGKVLVAIGLRAEPDVRPLVRHAGATIRRRACQILEKIGTRDSLPDLRARLEDVNKEVRDSAAAAITAIEKRDKGD